MMMMMITGAVTMARTGENVGSFGCGSCLELDM